MKTNFPLKRAVLLLLLLLTSVSTFAQFRVIGYVPSWAGDVNSVQYSKLTHINYAFLLPTATGGLQPIENPAKLQSLVSLAHANGVKVLISVGGWNDGNDSGFESIGANATYRNTFVTNLVNFANQYNLDGVDIDWEYPDAGASANNHALLMQQLSTEMHSRGKLLTAAVVGTNGASILNSVFTSVDFLNLMAYDFNNFDHSTYDYAVQSITYWKGRGLPANKTVLGVPFYGRPTWESYAQLLARGASPNADVFNGVGYNGIPTIKSKTNLAFDQGSGIMIWELSQDATGANSLLTAINQVVVQRNGVTPPPAQAIPGRIEAESSSAQSGTQTETTTDTGGGLNVAWYETGDWLDYSVNVAAAGSYTVGFRVTSAYGGATLQLRNSAGAVLGSINVGNTGGWQNWQTINATVTLPAGRQTLRLYAVASTGCNVNWLSFASTTPPPTSATTIQAEAFTSMQGVQVETTTDTGGGQNVGYIDATDWMAYANVTFPTSGSYTIEYRVASPSGSTLSSDLNAGAIQLGSVTIPATGGWQSWTTVRQTVNVNAGTYSFGVYAQAGGWNFNWLRITKATTAARPTGTTLATSSILLDRSLEVYPNPAGRTLHFRAEAGLIGSQYQVADVTGRTVLSGQLSATDLDVSTLKAGVYTLRLTAEGHASVTRRFVKEAE